MTKNKTKKTILVSLVAMLVCVAMLTGVTYALFTKSVTSANNVITTGVYNVSIQYAESIDDSYSDLPTTPIFSASDLAPRATVIRYIKLTNNNSFPVDVGVLIPQLTGTNNLAQYLGVYVNTNASTALDTSGENPSTLQSLANGGAYKIIDIDADSPTTIAAKSGDTPGTLIVAIGFKVLDTLPTDGTTYSATFNLTVELKQHA